MEFSRQEYWSGLPLPSPGDLPDPRVKPDLPHCSQILYRLSHQGSLWLALQGSWFVALVVFLLHIGTPKFHLSFIAVILLEHISPTPDLSVGFPGGLNGKESACQCRRQQVGSLAWDDLLEKEMATPSSILAWRIPWKEEPGGLQSMGSQRVGHNRTWARVLVEPDLSGWHR